MIGLRELASLLASAIVLFGSVLAPVGDEGTVAVESVDGGDMTRAVADEPVELELVETKVYDLVTSRGAPTAPASLEGGYQEIRFLTAPGESASIALADREMPVPPGSAITVDGFSGEIVVLDDDEGSALTLVGTATGLEIDPPEAPPVETQQGSEPSIPVANVSLGGDTLSGSVETAGSFDEIEFAVQPTSDLTPVVDVDGEVLPFNQTVTVSIADYVGLVVVIEADDDVFRLQLEGYGNVTVLGDEYDRFNEDVEVTSDNPNSEPSAAFSWQPTTPEAQETVHFQDGSQDDIAVRSWAWDFGDGATSEAQHPEHTYATSGTYDVTLTVTDAGGRTNTTTETVTAVNSRPVVELLLDPDPPTEGELVQITAEAEDRDGEIETYDWSIPNRTGLQDPTVNHTFPAQGLVEIGVTVTDDEGGEATANRQIEVQNAPPIADFTVDPSDPMARRTVYLESTSTDYGDGEVVDHRWEISSVGTRDGEIVEIEFPEDGLQEVTLEVHDDDGDTNRTTEQISVRNAPPEAEIKIGPRPLNPDSPIDFNADVTDDDPIEESSWTFSDGVEASGLSTERTFDEGGSYEVDLRLQDSDGDWGSANKSFYVNKAPSVELGPLGHESTDEIAVETDELFTVDARVDDPDSEEISLSWSVDGTPPTDLNHCTHAPDGNESRMQCGWPDDGEHRISVHARDEEGATNSTHLDVLVLNQPPTLNPSVLTDVVNVGERVTLEANAEDTDGVVETVLWWVDGEREGLGSVFRHTFQQPGTHEVAVNATDDDDAESSTTFEIDVNAPPEVDVSISPSEPEAGESITFTADATDPDGDDTALDYEWTFGDGANETGAEVTHVYDLADDYVVQLNVTDDAGATVITQQPLEVATPPLGAELSVSPSPPQAGQSATFSVDLEDGREVEKIDWNFGDGDRQTTGDGVLSTNHTYETPETFRVSVHIHADHGEERRLHTDLRVTAAESHDIVFEPRLPDGQCVDIDSEEVEVLARNLPTGTTIGLEDGDESWRTTGPCTLEHTFPAGTWSIGDQLNVRLQAGAAELVNNYDLGDERPIQDRDLRLLQAPVDLVDVTVFSPNQDSQSDEEDTYANPALPVFVTGSVAWVDGTTATNLDVDMTVDYRTPTDLTGFGARYHDDSFDIPDNGTFVEIVPAPLLAGSPSSYTPDPGPNLLYLPGQYHVSVMVDSGVFTDASTGSFVEDPAGIFASLDDAVPEDA